ncbi:MAG: hypothetical protein U9Q15_03360 [Patescibacteria group bacterium]|nr:hypothetical protein [Patescibacteria group bacterium]
MMAQRRVVGSGYENILTGNVGESSPSILGIDFILFHTLYVVLFAGSMVGVSDAIATGMMDLVPLFLGASLLFSFIWLFGYTSSLKPYYMQTDNMFHFKKLVAFAMQLIAGMYLLALFILSQFSLEISSAVILFASIGVVVLFASVLLIKATGGYPNKLF